MPSNALTAISVLTETADPYHPLAAANHQSRWEAVDWPEVTRFFGKLCYMSLTIGVLIAGMRARKFRASEMRLFWLRILMNVLVDRDFPAFLLPEGLVCPREKLLSWKLQISGNDESLQKGLKPFTSANRRTPCLFHRLCDSEYEFQTSMRLPSRLLWKLRLASIHKTHYYLYLAAGQMGYDAIDAATSNWERLRSREHHPKRVRHSPLPVEGDIQSQRSGQLMRTPCKLIEKASKLDRL